MNKEGKMYKMYSLFLTMLIVAVLMVAVPAQALTVTLSPASAPKVVKGEEVTFVATFNIKSQEQVPLNDITFKMGDNVCTFGLDGTEGCDGVTVEVLKFDSEYVSGKNTFKFKDQAYDYGYGYGYGNSKSGNGEIQYKITLDTSKFSAGKYDVSLEASVGSEKLTSGKHKVEIKA